ncbi:MAG: hypothetical protein VX899_20440 [Myxococcota bacterium]|nr:hypothetical protein [Myxococcota bacterium]
MTSQSDSPAVIELPWGGLSTAWLPLLVVLVCIVWGVVLVLNPVLPNGLLLGPIGLGGSFLLQGLSLLLNTTRLTLDGEQLSVHTGPLSLRGTQSVSRAELTGAQVAPVLLSPRQGRLELKVGAETLRIHAIALPKDKVERAAAALNQALEG